MPENSVLSGLIGWALAFTTFTLSSSLNCFNENVQLPVVRIYDTSLEDISVENNGTVILSKTIGQGDAIGWIGLECSHTKAVRWVFNLDYENLKVTYSTTTRNTGDFYKTNTYSFQADTEVQITDIALEFVFACVTFDDPCERKFAHVSYNGKENHYVLKSLSRFEENLTLVTDLEQRIIYNTNFGQKYATNSSCDVKFSFLDDGPKYYHLYTPQSEQYFPRTILDRQTLEITHFLTDRLSHECINNNCSQLLCHIDEKKDNTHPNWPLVFLMTLRNSNVSRVVHMYNTLVNRQNESSKMPGPLKFAWEYSNPQDFLELNELPEMVYVGQKISFLCTLSRFMFSYGERIGYISNISATNTINFLHVTPSSLKQIARTASGELVLPASEKNSKITVFCFAPIWNSSTEWVNISREFTVIEHTPVQFDGKENKVYMPTRNEKFQTSCTATTTGNHIPELNVTFPDNVTRDSVNVKYTQEINNRTSIVRAEIIIDHIDKTHKGVYKCIANLFGKTQSYEFEIKTIIPESAKLPTLTIVLISILVFISAVFIAVIIILYVRFHMEKEEFKRLTEEAIQEFLEGLNESVVPTDAVEHLYANDGVKILPYDRRFEIPHKKWSFSGTMLGAGAFGEVRKGEVEIGNRKSIVAIKTVKSAEDIDDFKAALLELKIMSNIGSHRHVVKLVAASTDEIHNRKVFIGVEFCANGNLLSYLQKRKKLFTNMVKDGQIQFQSTLDKKKNDPSTEEAVQQGAVEIMYENLVVTSDISTIDLFKWSFQIASGMDFLESKKVLHADLAARNILLTEELNIKISDFGLSRELFENSEYMKKTQIALPWKHMAPESLTFLRFTLKSDVWSYGVTLYEVFTLGEEPYHGQTWTEEFVTMLQNGMRLSRPLFCTDNVYTKIMMMCWQAEPNDRIRFADAMAFFEKAIGLLTSSHRNSDECRDVC